MKIKKVLRQRDINVLFEIINNREYYKENSEHGLVILLNGAWGSGKTTFLNDLEKEISSRDDYELFSHYDSYSYDFFENAYLPFFADIEEKIGLKKMFGKFIKSTSKNTFNGIVCTSYSITNSIFKKKFNMDLNDIKDNLLGIQNEEYLKSFKDFKYCKETIMKKMRKYCDNKTQVIIIDELDRCKPSFAMETLEIIKHFFDIKNCVFIIAVDKIQLQESAKTIYGQGMNSEKYFSKYFDYQYNLLPLNFNEIVDTSGIEDLEQIVNRSTTIFNYLGVSSRDSKKIFGEFIGKYRYFNNEEKKWSGNQSLFIIFLLTLKYVDLLFYYEIIGGNYLRYKKKITDEINPLSNNYNRLLEINIGDKRDFNYVCSKLNYETLQLQYLDVNKINGIWYLNNIETNKEISAAKEMSNYIPFIKDKMTYKETIEFIIN